MKSILFLLSIIFLAACSTTPEKVDPELQKQTQNIGTFIETPIPKPDNKNILYSLSRYYGKPHHQSFSKRSNLTNPKQKEKNYTMVYEGFEIDVAEEQQKEEANYYVRRLVVHDNVLKLPFGVKIGQNLENIKKIFGEPLRQSKSDKSVSYCRENSKQACVRFYLSESEDKLERIIWDYAANN